MSENIAPENKTYMKKFVVETPYWVDPKDIIAIAQSQVVSNYLIFNSKNKKFLVTINAEEV